MRGSYLFHLMLLSLSWPCMALEGEARRFGDTEVDLGGGTLASNEARARLNDDITLHKFIIIPEIKLLFCSIPKVAHSQFHQILQAVREVARREQGLKEPLPQTKLMLHMNTPEYHGLDIADLEGMLMDPAWKKAVFYRDPVTRFLSGYRSKCEEGHDEEFMVLDTARFSSAAVWPPLTRQSPLCRPVKSVTTTGLPNTSSVAGLVTRWSTMIWWQSSGHMMRRVA
ncbi:unnamed protein product [Chrysoparadoxa australica]